MNPNSTLAEWHQRLAAAAPGAPPDAELRAYFGADEYRRLTTLLAPLSVVDEREVVVLVPDFMGSELWLTDPAGGPDRPFWLHLPALTQGLDPLELWPDPAGPELLTVGGPDLRLYARALLALGRRWNVRVFAYDWRQPAKATALLLNEFLAMHVPTGAVRLVAHGFGALVAQCWLRQPHQPLGPDSRLVLVGAPNAGSYWAVQLLAGTERLVRWLDRLDQRNCLPEVQRILNTFPSTYELLPFRQLDPDAALLYQPGTWGRLPVQGPLLAAADALHEELAAGTAPDLAQVAAVLGCNQPTIQRLSLVSAGEFQFYETVCGDGRVAFRADAPPAVPTYYAAETHGSLLRNPLVLDAVSELLTGACTAALPLQPVLTRSLLRPGQRWHRPIGEDIAGVQLEAIASQYPASGERSAEAYAAEEALLRAVAGEDNPTLRLDHLPASPATTPSSSLAVRVLRRDLCLIDTDLLMVGRYVGAPLTGRLLNLDLALGSWIRRAVDQGLLSGELGKVFCLPRPPRGAAAVQARALLLLGMGEEGCYTSHDLRYLMSNASFAAISMGTRQWAAVVLGSRNRQGRGTLSEEQALQSLLQGTAEGIARCGPSAEALNLELTLVARDKEQFQRQCAFFREVAKATGQPVEGLTIHFLADESVADPVEAEKNVPASDNLSSDLPPAEWGPRITIEIVDSRYRFTALVDGAVVPIRELSVQPDFPNILSGRLMEAVVMQEQETYGELLATLLFPLDFQDYFTRPLTFILDRSTASLPWEMACFAQLQNQLAQAPGPAVPRRSLGRELQLARQFRTMLSPRPGLPPPRNHSLRILVVADPAPEPHLQLPGARREGRAVVEMLSRLKVALNQEAIARQQEGRSAIKLDIIDRIGAAECDFLEIMALILNGKFDVIHFAGHGIYEADNPARQGWVFGQDRVLTAREIFRARHVPRLVFANACFSAAVRPGSPFTADELNGGLAGVAEAFFERGVRNYLGTGWPVHDEQAVVFAQEFYAQALTGGAAQPLASQGGELPATVGAAVAAARNAIYPYGGSSWGAYQHYGQATDRLLDWR